MIVCSNEEEFVVNSDIGWQPRSNANPQSQNLCRMWVSHAKIHPKNGLFQSEHTTTNRVIAGVLPRLLPQNFVQILVTGNQEEKKPSVQGEEIAIFPGVPPGLHGEIPNSVVLTPPLSPM